eukprot:TRINITY_DN400_c4_g1_i3.p1 TRINITY_DN400_c4_g1~~TRINITY_DN400_c4_g1_i3.p1  ORF type:complete len:1004 (+),score=177.52 TRINITY_DN400_c4_g1_i3:132-3143(+)
MAMLAGLTFFLVQILIGVSSAGYALLFHDDIAVKKDFKNFPTDQFTFEAWISTSDECHKGTIMSYALNSTEIAPQKRSADFNHFVIFNPNNLLACHDYQYMDLEPDQPQSCHYTYNNSITADFVEASGQWHHLAVTWDGKKNGNMKIYQDGMLVAEAVKQNTRPLLPGGAFMLGADQDCFGGCTDFQQGFYGLMDEVRIWSKVRNQDEIIRTMRTSNVVNDPDLVAYWKFDDPDSNPNDPEAYTIARDSSRNGNDLVIKTKPSIYDATVSKGTSFGGSLQMQTKAISFSNNYAIKSDFDNMPEDDFSIEFWARTSSLDENIRSEGEEYAEFFSFASISPGDGMVGNDGLNTADTAFIDDAIRIDRYLTDFQGTSYLTDADNRAKSTRGSVSLHINANRGGNGKRFDNWIDYRVNWNDNGWHHLAFSWEKSTGNTQFWFDGIKQVPFWVSNAGQVSDKDESKGGVDPHIGANTARSPLGSLVLAQNQECYAGCFSPMKSYHGEMAVLRIWNKILDTQSVKNNMYNERPSDPSGLVNLYTFRDFNSQYIYDEINGQHLLLGAEGPQWEYSTAPLTNNQGIPLHLPQSVISPNYALRLNDRQVLMHTEFKNFPNKAITVEFWMWSTDNCRRGAPFSYAAGDYRSMDNAFLLFDYNNWGISVLEDEGQTGSDHDSGIFATDGRWHFMTVSWESKTGRARLYQDGKLVWVVERSKGKSIPSGGTLVVGREQDCKGGCFDSEKGAVGPIQTATDAEHGDQDFYGIMDEMRVWNIELTPQQVSQNYLQDLDLSVDDSTPPLDYKNNKNLVAHWTFDTGAGYRVFDVTGNGHDLHILQEPQWIPVKWVQTKRAEVGICGNGLREGAEQCDDGLRGQGEGCDKDCKIKPGYSCNDVSPSVCYPVDQEKLKNVLQKIKTERESHPEYYSPQRSSHSHSGKTVVVLIVVVLVIAAVAVALYIKRDWVGRQLSSLSTRNQLTYHRQFDDHNVEALPLETVQYSQLSDGEQTQQTS